MKPVASGIRALAIYSAIAIAFTWPLAWNISSVVPHDLGDPIGFTWILWWNAHATPLTQAWLDAPIFHPASGTIVFQDALLGVWPLSTAVQGLGGSPLAAHNVLTIASFALSAWTAFLLCRRLFGDGLPAFAGGLVYGFAIFRVSQMAHLNIQLTFWIPVTFYGLHAYLDTRRNRWLVLATAAWAVQAITSGYFLAFTTVLIGMWALFFFRTALRDYLKLAVALALGFAAIWPVLSLYRSVHAMYGFRRGLSEAEAFSADVVSVFRAPPYLTVWGSSFGYDINEDQFFPGLVLAVVIVATVVASRYLKPPRLSKLTISLLGVAAIFGAVSAVAIFAPGPYEFAGLRLSLNRPFKPLSWVWISLLVAIAVSPPVRRLVRDRSLAGFYALAAFVLWLLTLGPSPKAFGYRIWYRGPYSWLDIVPGADSVRVPARFWMLVMLALGVVLAYGLTRLQSRRPDVARAVMIAVCVAVLVEAWPGRLPLPAPPVRLQALEQLPAAEPSLVLELPMDSPGRNYASMYRAMFHGRPLVNGASGYMPAASTFLDWGIKTGEPGVLRPFAELQRLDVVVDTTAPDATALVTLVEHAGARATGETDGFRFFRLERQQPAGPSPDSGAAATIARVTHPDRGDVTALLTDARTETLVEAKRLEVVLARPCRADEVRVGLSPGVDRLVVTMPAVDAPLWAGPIAELGVRAALENPADPRVRARFAPVLVDRITIDPRVPAGETEVYVSRVEVLGADCGPGR